MKFTKYFLILYSLSLMHNVYAMEYDTLKNIGIGSTAAVVEVAVNQPLIYFKNMVQQGKPIAMEPKVLWHGAPGNAGSLAPVTAIQLVTNNTILKQLENNGHQLNTSAKMGAAFSAGVLSGLVSGPSENIMLLQQNSDGKFHISAKNILRSYGTRGMYRALVPTMMRDGGFSAGFLGLRPIVKKELEGTIPNETALNLASGISSGIVASVVTHPFDTLKTVMQADLADKKSASSIKTLLKIIQKDSARGLFKGLIARSTRVASAITVMGFVTDNLSNVLK